MSAGVYARETTVPAEKSRGEIERILSRYGATAFGYGWNERGAVVTFAAHGRRVQFTLTMPARDDPQFTTYRRGQFSAPTKRTPAEAERRWEQATRQRWRALALVVKAKLEAVAVGIATFEEEFLPYTLVPGPDGRPVTVAEAILPRVAEAYETGEPIDGPLVLALPAAGETT